jgi:dienelactone hydrolase
MNQHQLPSDIVGLAKIMPPLSRRGFMSSSTAAAAGYTLAAGPVRADVIHTDTKGLEAGEADTGISVDRVHHMEAALKASGKTAEFHIYPGAPHGFVADYRASYRKEAAEDAWNRMVGWFKTYKVVS